VLTRYLYHGKNLSHIYNGKIVSTCQAQDDCTILQKPSNLTFISSMSYRKKMNIAKSSKNCIVLEEVKPKIGLTVANLNNLLNYFCTKMTNTYSESIIDNKNPTSLIIHDVRQSLHRVNAIHGPHQMDTLNEPVYILIPGAGNLKHIALCVQDYQCLEKLLMEGSIIK
jgi:hypothetical protein